MEAFMIKYKQVKNSKSELLAYARQIKKYADDVDAIRRNLRGKISSYDQLGNRLRQLSDQLDCQGKKIEILGEKAESVGREYEKAEQKILGTSLDFMGLLGDLAGELGAVGPSASTILSWVADGWPEDALDGLLDVGDMAVGTLDKIMEGLEEGWTKAEWKNWLGFNPTDYAADEKFLARWWKNGKKEVADFFDDFKFREGFDVGKALGVAGAALGLAGTAKENYDEYASGEISGGRAFFETAGEWAVDWAVGIGLTAAAAAMLPVGAPAVAVGALATGAAWALDQLFEGLTGKSLAETVSDTVIDTVLDVGDAIADWWDSLW